MELEKLIFKVNSHLYSLYRKYSANCEDIVNISYSEYFYVEALNILEDATYSDLAQYLNLSKPSVTNMVKKLISKGLIYKIQSEKDRRKSYLYLTDKGKLLLEQDYNVVNEFTQEIKDSLTEDELEKYKELTRIIVDKIIK
ncbi:MULTISPECIES: MarR family winged helix-turn-helix transcriptional regulator [unclassified Clostridium]|uniref:MarR family winged helix-turn-helix transcriptional regulator n=1 Tax=unclassified Clostridium TaxID=2614128 RepID=UPI0025BB3C5B|nr:MULTISPECIES: MarR family transcriptional regulator [unclassified Clostridium]